jgi:CRISPR/Cas system CSM-associated protein Csm3 (group 7 of RAMP superfamily)
VPHDDAAIDRDILLDATGRPWVPGSSLAGSLRAHLAAADPPADVRIMGSRPPRNQAEAAASAASPLWIAGVVFTPVTPDGHDGTGDGLLETTGQTAIDRKRRAARTGSLRISRLAARGGHLTIYMRHQSGDPLTPDDLALIAAWRPAIGRDRTAGSGRARLIEIRHGTIDPTTPGGARTWLTCGGQQLFEAVATTVISCDSADQPWLEATFEITDGLLVGDRRAGRVTTARKRNGRPLIPGSAWKGIFRSRIEYIIRSRYGEAAICDSHADSGNCPACAVFGHQGQRGALAFRDSYIDIAKLAPDVKRTHVGIDRVTGGARDALLYETAPIPDGTVSLRIDQLAPVPCWVRNAIWHVIRDLDDGLIGLGARTTTGLGTLHLTAPPGALDALEPVVVNDLEPVPAPEPSQ